MDIFDKISDTAFFIGKEVSEKAKDVGSYAKLQYEIRTREGYLDELFRELGKKYYVEHKDDEDADFKEIEGLTEELKQMREELMLRKGAEKCPKCGNIIARDSDYCNKCGMQLKGVDIEED